MVGCLNLGNYQFQCSYCLDGENFQPAPNQTGKQARTKISEVLLENYAGMFDEKFSRLEKRRPTPGSIELAFKPREVASRLVTEWLSPTLTAGGGAKRAQESLVIPQTGTGSVSSIDTHDAKQRKAFVAQLEMLSIREAAKLQDVPQWYGFEGSRAEAFKQIGMGVPVNLGRGVMAHVRRAMGLPLRAPWWETRVPVKPRDIRFESREQIARTPAGQLKGGAGSGQPDGLWPTEAFDMCYAVPPILAVGGLLPSSFIEDDWDTYVTMGEIGTQAQRAAGNSKLDRLIDRLPPRIQAAARKQRGGRVKSLFTEEGLGDTTLITVRSLICEWCQGFKSCAV
jgi:hypothetical protein